MLSNGCPGEAICSRLDLPAVNALVGGRQALPSDDSIHLPTPSAHNAIKHVDVSTRLSIHSTMRVPRKSLAHFGKRLASRLETSRVHEMNSAHTSSRHSSSSTAAPGSQCYSGVYYFGCTDSKVTNSSLFWSSTSRIQGGPTHDDQIPFEWPLDQKPYGQPLVFEFDWFNTQPASNAQPSVASSHTHLSKSTKKH